MMKRTVCLCLALLLLLPMLLTGCGSDLEKTTKGFNTVYGDARIGYHMVTNDRFELHFQDDGVQQVIMLHDLTTDAWYGSTPYDYYMGTNPISEDNAYADNQLYSPISITYVKTDADTDTSSTDSAEATSHCIEVQQYKDNPVLDENGNPMMDEAGNPVYEREMLYIDSPFGDGTQWNKNGITSEALDNGVRVTYSFPDLHIAVAVEYLLADNGMVVRIPMDRIEEDENLLFEVKVLPYFASAAHNNKNPEDSYLMLPSGGGALVYARDLNKKAAYSEPVYGADQSVPVTMLKKVQRQIHLPVFGAKNGATGVIGILEDGASCGYINANVGDKDIGYSGAYASFRVRGEEEVMYTTENSQEDETPRYSESIANYEALSVRYIPLDGDTSYMGMANTYRNYLKGKGYLQTRPASVPGLSVSLLGGTETRESFFGLPYDATTITTSAAQTETIAKELKELIGDEQLLVTLMGYGEGGMANTVVGGGFELEGDSDEWEVLQKYAKENNVLLAIDYELVQFKDGGAGFSTDDAVYGVAEIEAQVRTYVLNTAVEDEEEFWYLLSREKLPEAVQEAIDAAKEDGFGAISFATLSHAAYSDYHDGNYTAKAQMAEDVAAFLKKCTENGLTVVSTKANEYAILNADYVIEAPVQSSKFNVFDAEIPFYSLVFQGYKALTSTAINTATNVEDAYLNAVATGSSLQFTLCDTLHDALRFEENTAYITSRYSDWKDDIAAMVAESSELHSKVGTQAIVEYAKKDGVSKTVFEDGTTVYVNYLDEALTQSQIQKRFPEYNQGDMDANSFK